LTARSFLQLAKDWVAPVPRSGVFVYPNLYRETPMPQVQLEPRWKQPIRSCRIRGFRRLREPKALTIAIAAKCTDGLVMCSDTQVTHPGGYKSHECKISTIQLAENRGTLLLSYAGIPDDERAIVELISNNISGQDKTFEKVREALQDALNKVLGRSKRNHQMLCGFCDSGNFRLLKSSDRVISPVPIWDCVGYGDGACQ
jgi:hypothetical protein